MKSPILALILTSSLAVQASAQRSNDRYAIVPHFGLQFFSTDRVGLFAGLSYRPSLESDRTSFWAVAAGGELGIAGGQLNVGVARHLRPAIADVGGLGADISVKAQLGYLRTWGDPAHVGPQQSFLGPEVQLMWSLVGVRIGYFGRVSGDGLGDESFLTLGLILGWH